MVYVTGGNSQNDDAVEHVYTFDVENNRWNNELPSPQYHNCIPVVLGGKLSLIGGCMPGDNTVVAKVNTYNEYSNQWVMVYPDMNQPRLRPAVVNIDRHVIVMGGKIEDCSKVTDSIEIMNIKNKQWITLATPLPSKMYHMPVTMLKDLIWIIGYDDGSDWCNKVFTISASDLIYQTTTKHPWKSILNDATYHKVAVVAYSDPPVIVGGEDKQNNTVSAVVAFDPKTDSWSEVATLSSPRAHSTVVKLPGERGMLVIGGCSKIKHLSQCSSSCSQATEIYYISSK